MDPLVPDEVGALAESLVAELAEVGPGSGVRPQVLGDGRAVIEGPPTLSTLERPLPSMNPLVLREGGALDEGLPAVPAHVGLLSRVDFPVHREVPGVPEQFAARAAAEHLAPLVDLDKRDLRGAPAFPGSAPLAALLGFHLGITRCLSNA